MGTYVYTTSYYVKAERYWHFVLEGTKAECEAEAERLRKTGHEARVKRRLR